MRQDKTHRHTDPLTHRRGEKGAVTRGKVNHQIHTLYRDTRDATSDRERWEGDREGERNERGRKKKRERKRGGLEIQTRDGGRDRRSEGV